MYSFIFSESTLHFLVEDDKLACHVKNNPVCICIIRRNRDFYFGGGGGGEFSILSNLEGSVFGPMCGLGKSPGN